ncbi:MAG: ATP-binding protein [Flavobacteriales bacterium]|nr:ATP-binding protein [Flavobacteriales bacterium]MCX7768807.1 ATP-binding protein [Flavobacteriales bacterium]MDW8410664.1 ATP-binding protein [Flavobacteriales bacterium]
MKNQTPAKLSLYSALSVGVVSVASGALLLWLFNKEFAPLYLLFHGLVIFGVAFFIFRYTINTFIYEKIKLVYKTIHQMKLGKKKEDLRKKLDSGEDIISDVKKEVEEWEKDKAAEIDALKKEEKFRREFIGNLAHELKTPIHIIQGFISTLQEDPDMDPKIRNNFLEKAARNVDRMINLINDLDTISRLESKQMQLDLDKVNVVKLVEEVFESLEMKARERNIRLYIKHDNLPSPEVLGDAAALRQVLTNLVLNSIVYGNPNGSTKVCFFEMGDHILVEVADDGPGIAPEHLPRIFERFYRVDKSRSRNMGGTGLGLSIVKHIIEAHVESAGALPVNVRSEVGKGATFSFALLRYSARNKVIKNGASGPQTDSAPAS